MNKVKEFFLRALFHAACITGVLIWLWLLAVGILYGSKMLSQAFHFSDVQGKHLLWAEMILWIIALMMALSWLDTTVKKKAWDE